MSKDERWRVVPEQDTRELVEHVCEATGRKRGDVLREALQIGIEPIANEVNRRATKQRKVARKIERIQRGNKS